MDQSLYAVIVVVVILTMTVGFAAMRRTDSVISIAERSMAISKSSLKEVQRLRAEREQLLAQIRELEERKSSA